MKADRSADGRPSPIENFGLIDSVTSAPRQKQTLELGREADFVAILRVGMRPFAAAMELLIEWKLRRGSLVARALLTLAWSATRGQNGTDGH